jgi:hypothetical protein
MIKTKDDSKKEYMRMIFMTLVYLKNESIKIQRAINLLRFYSITFFFVLYVCQQLLFGVEGYLFS